MDTVGIALERQDADLGSAAVYFPPGVQFLYATIRLQHDDATTEEVGAVGIELFPAGHCDDDEFWWIEADLQPELVVRFDIVDIKRAHLGKRYGLRLVAESLSEISFGRTCLASIVAEPKGWESLKQRDRGPAIVALDRHWAQLGFDGGEVRADVPGERRMSMVARDFAVPDFLPGKP